MAADVLRVDNLRVGFNDGDVVQNLSFSIQPGQTLALVGESGSGKSVTARSLIGLAGAGARVRADTMDLEGRPVQRLSARQWRGVRGADIGFILQDALVSLDPLRTVGREIEDALRLRSSLNAAQRRARVLELLQDVGMDDPALRAGQHSGELSGGLRQRALIASAIALNPPLLIADEPTTALDATVQAQILALLRSLCEGGTALLLISHDLAVVSRVADQVAVMSGGSIVESGPVNAVLGSPQHRYTQQLLQAVPSGHPRGTRLSTGTGGRQGDGGPADGANRESTAPVLEVEELIKTFPTSDGDFTAVDAVSFSLERGQTLGLVGESGSGKTTAARIVLGLTAPDSGEVRLFGEPWSAVPERERRRRRPLIGAVYQDPLSSFDPRLTVGQLLTDALSGGRTMRSGSALSNGRALRVGRLRGGQSPRGDLHGGRTARGDPPKPGGSRPPEGGFLRQQVTELLDMVGLPSSIAARGPRNLSGGQRQRVAIARAVAPRPRIIVCDEPASSLDVSIQAQVLDLLDELQREFGLSYLFISHDLGVVRHMSDDVAVMQRGRIVEQAPAERIFTAPQHPYTRRLLEASPRLHI